MRCRDRIERAGELDADAASLARAIGRRWHLLHCSSCRTYLRQLDFVLVAARSLGDTDGAEAPGLVDAVMARLA